MMAVAALVNPVPHAGAPHAARVIPLRPLAAWRGAADCRRCGIRQTVLFGDLTDEDLDLIHAPIDDLAFDAGATLYHEGEAAPGVFTIRRGAVKLVRHAADGRVRIVRVLRAGDVAGIEALATQRYDSEAVALDAVAACRIPLSVVERLDRHSPRLRRRLLLKWQRALREADDWLAELNFGSARERVARLVARLRDPLEPAVVTLYSREDMGAMLDLKLETVSREISALVRAGILEPLDRMGRRYRIADPGRLEDF